MNIGIYIYDNAEVLDFAGPFEVLATVNRLAGLKWNVFLVSDKFEIVNARGNFAIHPHYTLNSHPKIDVLIVVGGISAGIDMSLHLVVELSSLELARKTARQMEYRWQGEHCCQGSRKEENEEKYER